ncbi:MAG: hypothetical protein NTY86_04675, partial [Deltaproteobacteria bacterium]|nr:hypothetical protein [Deltaproteobacteria bacterium]
MIADSPLRRDSEKRRRDDVGDEGHDQQIGVRAPERLDRLRGPVAVRLKGRDPAAVGGRLQGVGFSACLSLGEPGGDDLFPPIRQCFQNLGAEGGLSHDRDAQALLRSPDASPFVHAFLPPSCPF